MGVRLPLFFLTGSGYMYGHMTSKPHFSVITFLAQGYTHVQAMMQHEWELVS